MIFELAGISHFYGNEQALNDVSVSIKPGTVGLLGPNGAGKTTLIKTLLGLLDPYAGDGDVLGHNIRNDAVRIRERVGYMPEQEAIFEDLTGLESVVLMARICGIPRNHALRRAHEVLDYAGVNEERYRPCGGYSTGMKQRIKLAQALVHGPELVFLDEPTNGLDPQGREAMLGLIDQLNGIGVSTVLSTHLLSDVEQVCTDVLVLVDGQIRHYGPLSALTQGQSGLYEVEVKHDCTALIEQSLNAGWKIEHDADNAQLFIVELDGQSLDTFWRMVVDTKTQVRQFTPLKLSLESAFVQLIEAK